ncbi:MAG: polysaccharide ABC transporter ATP-binding protein [Bacteroidota bacterium]
MTGTAIKVEGLSKKYYLGYNAVTISERIKSLFPSEKKNKRDEFWALKDVSFEIKEGEAVGIIGRNGAGKSTLLKLLSRITLPTTGRFELNGRVSSLLEVGTGFHPELSGQENIYLNGTILGMTRKEVKSKFDEIVEFAGVEKFLSTPVKHYSSGMTVRLAFSVAAHLEPEILIVDEVLAVGDAEFQKKCLGKMDDVSKSDGKTVIFVSHDMTAIENLCNRAILLNKGSVIVHGDVHTTIRSYLSQVSRKSKVISLNDDQSDNKDFLFKSICFREIGHNDLLEFLSSGLDIEIKINYLSKIRDSPELIVSIGFFTQNGTFLFACRTDTINRKLSIKENGELICMIPNFPLRNGVYYFNIIAYSKGEVLDHIQTAGEITVEGGDFYGTGKTPAGNRPGILVQYDWAAH